ncbi:MAG: 2-hydroxyacyl-CoA dehydratase [Ruminococcaceae bacterium]|jgi:benzoyl-CoA reductase/2-hydroxyglutaryl-CoA dehydratase subunit BcrC/BadD/HgdB|nr:2-hydroxyacyl-CoA dehydratase [Oscillospiraceae bacterium]
MAIRNEALACEAFVKLKTAYDDRKAVLSAWKNSGKRVVCIAGYDVPEEIILAAGMLPFRVTGYYGGARVSADKYLEYSFGAIWKGLWESIAEDYAGLMDYLVFCSSSDMFLKLFYYFRTMQRLEPDRPLPELRFLDYELVQHSFKSQERNERELRDLIETVEGWSGRKVTKEDLSAAIALCNEYRDALNAFSALRGKDNCRVTGSEALVVIGGSMFMEKQEAIALVRAVTEAAQSWQCAEGERVYYVGSPQEITEVYELAEANGLNFVGEDHDMGARMFDTQVRTDIEPVSALADRLLKRMPSSEKGSIAARVAAIGEKLTETAADGFLTFMNNNDESYVWDYPSIRKKVLEVRGIPSATVQKQTWPLTEPEALAAQFREFAATVKEAHHG